MTANYPKIDLHCHLEGTAPPGLVRRLARRNGIDLPPGLFDGDGGFAWSDFSGFLKAYDLASSAIRTSLDYRDVTYQYLKSCAAEGGIYAEVFSSPDHAAGGGLSYAGHLEGMIQGIDDAERDFAITGRIIVTCVRHLGPGRAVAVADAVVAEPHPYVVGFGMGGDENCGHIGEFAPAFDKVNRAGLPCTVHAGEVCGPDSVAQALDALPVVRIGHGVRSVEDPGVLDRIVGAGVTLEICSGSNLALGLYDGVHSHPLPDLLAAGCKVVLGADDPPYFATSIGVEYGRAETEFGLNRQDIARINQNALAAAFCDAATLEKLKARL